MVLYMEQYIVTSYSGRSRDPAKVPLCQRPDDKSCDWMNCSWSSPDAKALKMHSYQFLRCAKPPAFRLVVSAGCSTLLNVTFDKSQVVKIDASSSVNVTIKRPLAQSLGVQVGLVSN